MCFLFACIRLFKGSLRKTTLSTSEVLQCVSIETSTDLSVARFRSGFLGFRNERHEIPGEVVPKHNAKEWFSVQFLYDFLDLWNSSNENTMRTQGNTMINLCRSALSIDSVTFRSSHSFLIVFS